MKIIIIIIANCLRIYAKINPEIKVAIPENTLNRDKGIEAKQKRWQGYFLPGKNHNCSTKVKIHRQRNALKAYGSQPIAMRYPTWGLRNKKKLHPFFIKKGS